LQLKFATATSTIIKKNNKMSRRTERKTGIQPNVTLYNKLLYTSARFTSFTYLFIIMLRTILRQAHGMIL